ncbi:MAG: hypothetical protein EB078_07840 [Proteobacteria bacterium]|nr:hypothetical protein [Pseudomonadota bacterium]NDD04803.1 hypothetical protein [Pseudomonadota bacterium]
MADPLKPISTEIVLTTANSVSEAVLVRVVNTDGANSAVITLQSNTGTVLATFTLGPSGTDFGKEYVVKNPTDTLKANNATNNGAYAGAGIKAVSVAYR